jgi:hypothetical protein
MRTRSHSRRHLDRLPLELIERIIDFFHDSRKDLYHCALVCKAWLAPSRYHLFYSICICPDPSKRWVPCFWQYDLLYETLQQSPHIAHYVREFRFLSVSQMADPNWPLPKQIASLLQSFTNLRKLTLCSIFWETLSLDMKEALREALARPSLTQLYLERVIFSATEDLAELIYPHLKRLQAWILWASNFRIVPFEGTNVMVEGRQPCRLELIEIFMHTHFVPFVEWLLGTQLVFDISNLRDLDVWMGYEMQRTVTRLIRRAESTLEHITIRNLKADNPGTWAFHPLLSF